MKEVEKIIRVNHAGELGAIYIYKAQRIIASVFYKDIVDKLDKMLKNEEAHFKTFSQWLTLNNVRNCYALWFWALGGFILGFITAILGRKPIWVCTNTVEAMVVHHLEWQLSYLKTHDRTAYLAVLNIKSDQEVHQKIGLLNGSNSSVYLPIKWLAKYATKFSLWLSKKL